MKTILEQAQELKNEIIKNRRIFHGFAEIAFDLPQTTAHVTSELKSYGLEPIPVGKAGITCTVGSGKPVILLRADMDALPMPETSGLDFAATNGHCHSCGHDTHTAMLLGAAKLLKQNEDRLKGTVKFMFQPAEEVLGGAKDMLENGILENPKVDAAFALHIAAGTDESTTGAVYHNGGPVTFSGDAIDIVVNGKEAHGSTPYLGIDAVYAAAQIVVALGNIKNNFIPSEVPSVVLAGKINGGTAVNTVADKCEINVSCRSKTHEHRALIIEKIKEIAENTAKVYGATAVVTHKYGMPPLVNNPELDTALAGYLTEILGDNVKLRSKFNGSEDFSIISEHVPVSFMSIGVGSIEEGYEHSLHHSAIKINEDALPVGCAVYAHAAIRFLEEN